MSESTADTADLYATYDAWKGWEAPFACDAAQAAYYAAELRGRAVRDADVLEIGFGAGSFLAWARAQGARVTGSEITPGAIAAAREAGVTLIPGDFERDGLSPGAFDIVVALDVFEHLDPQGIRAKLAAIDTGLRPDGWLLLRYPNGQSPYGLDAQHGDATHVVALSRAKIEQYAAGTSLVTLYYGGVARPRGGGAAKRMARALRYALRSLHGRLIRFIYANAVELEPVVTHILVKGGAPK